MKHLTLETCKRLAEAGIFDTISTCNFYNNNGRVISSDRYEILAGELGVPDIIEEEIVGRTKCICGDCKVEIKSYESFKYKCDCSYWKGGFFGASHLEHIYSEEDFVAAPNLEEAIELLPKTINEDYLFETGIDEEGKWWINYVNNNDDFMFQEIDFFIKMETLLEAVELMIVYLLDNGLIGKNQ